MADEVVDFRDLLNKPMSDFPDLPDLPAQKHFFGKLISMNAGASRQKQTPLFHFDVRLTDPGEDVPPDFLKKLADAGFNLADYNQVGADFYLTANSMKMLRRFATSLGFSPNASFTEVFHLDTEGVPTNETQDKLRGLDVLVKIPSAGQNNRVYANNVNSENGSISGTKRE